MTSSLLIYFPNKLMGGMRFPLKKEVTGPSYTTEFKCLD